MYKDTLMKSARRLFLLAAGTGAMLVSGGSPVMAAPGGGGGPLTCDGISVSSPTTVGVPVTFTSNTSGGKGNKTYAWTFSGPATPPSASVNPVNVTYSQAGGPFAVNLHVTDSKGGECSDATSVTITPGGGNNPPVANDDSYNATDGQTLNVGPPGVLSNDADESPATLTAVLQVTTYQWYAEPEPQWRVHL